MHRFTDLTLSQFLDAIASPTPTPGGGSVAAMAGALGAALLQMVAGLPRTRTNSEDERAALARSHAELTRARETLVALADRDSEAYDAVTRAYKGPKRTEQEKEARARAVQAALRAATLVPLETVRAIVSTLDLAHGVASAGNTAASSDTAVAIGLLRAACDGAAMNVRANLPGVVDEGFRREIQGELDQLLSAAGPSGSGRGGSADPPG